MYLLYKFLAIFIVITISGCGLQTQRREINSSTHEERINKLETQKDRELLLYKLATGEISSKDYIDIIKKSQYSAYNENYYKIKIFFATDRNLLTKKEGDVKFGSERSYVIYGSFDVSIPKNHRIGNLESSSIQKLQFSENPEKHIVVLRTDIKDKEKFFLDLQNHVKKSKNNNAFLFVHGYNVTFEDAAKRTAQIAYDLKFDGAPVFYSWPSQGNLLLTNDLKIAYEKDDRNVDLTENNLKNFLEDFFQRSDAKNIYLIAHSMGNRALTKALASLLQSNPSIKERLKEVILAAPDIDAEVFKRNIAPALVAAGRPITLYASSKDSALKASKLVHGYPRAGESGDSLVVMQGIETIDATATDTSLIGLGHSYFADTEPVLSDIFSLIKYNKRAHERFKLQSVDTHKDGRYWKFAP